MERTESMMVDGVQYEVRAAWSRAESPVYGRATGGDWVHIGQVADYRHDPDAALHALLQDDLDRM